MLAREPENRAATQLMADAHEALLAAGGDESFWEQGWLQHELERWRKRLRSRDGSKPSWLAA